MAGNGLDLLLAALLAISMINGLRQGLVRLLGGVLSMVAAVLVSISCYKSAAFWIEKEWGVQDYLAAWISRRMPAIPVSNGTIRMPDLGLADPVTYLAYLALLALTFTGMLILLTWAGNSIVVLVHRVFKCGGLSGVNRLLGMAVGVLKSLLIMTLIIGISYPFIGLGAQVGLTTAVFLESLISHSKIANDLLTAFTVLQAGLGLSV